MDPQEELRRLVANYLRQNGHEPTPQEVAAMAAHAGVERPGQGFFGGLREKIGQDPGIQAVSNAAQRTLTIAAGLARAVTTDRTFTGSVEGEGLFRNAVVSTVDANEGNVLERGLQAGRERIDSLTPAPEGFQAKAGAMAGMLAVDIGAFYLGGRIAPSVFRTGAIQGELALGQSVGPSSGRLGSVLNNLIATAPVSGVIAAGDPARSLAGTFSTLLPNSEFLRDAASTPENAAAFDTVVDALIGIGTLGVAPSLVDSFMALKRTADADASILRAFQTAGIKPPANLVAPKRLATRVQKELFGTMRSFMTSNLSTAVRNAFSTTIRNPVRIASWAMADGLSLASRTEGSFATKIAVGTNRFVDDVAAGVHGTFAAFSKTNRAATLKLLENADEFSRGMNDLIEQGSSRLGRQGNLFEEAAEDLTQTAGGLTPGAKQAVTRTERSGKGRLQEDNLKHLTLDPHQLESGVSALKGLARINRGLQVFNRFQEKYMRQMVFSSDYALRSLARGSDDMATVYGLFDEFGRTLERFKSEASEAAGAASRAKVPVKPTGSLAESGVEGGTGASQAAKVRTGSSPEDLAYERAIEFMETRYPDINMGKMVEDITGSVNQALDLTFAMRPEQLRKISQSVLKAYDNIPALALVSPFPRFMAQSTEFLHDRMPYHIAKFLDPANRLAFRSGGEEMVNVVANLTEGMTYLSAAMFMRKTLGGPKWYQIRNGTDEDGNPTYIDMRQIHPMSTALLVANAMGFHGDAEPMPLNGRDIAEAMSGMRRIGDTGAGVFFNFLIEDNPERFVQKLFTYAQDMVGIAGTPLKTPKAIWSAVMDEHNAPLDTDAQARIPLPNGGDLALPKILNELVAAIPGVGVRALPKRGNPYRTAEGFEEGRFGGVNRALANNAQSVTPLQAEVQRFGLNARAATGIDTLDRFMDSYQGMVIEDLQIDDYVSSEEYITLDQFARKQQLQEAFSTLREQTKSTALERHMPEILRDVIENHLQFRDPSELRERLSKIDLPQAWLDEFFRVIQQQQQPISLSGEPIAALQTVEGRNARFVQRNLPMRAGSIRR